MSASCGLPSEGSVFDYPPRFSSLQIASLACGVPVAEVTVGKKNGDPAKLICCKKSSLVLHGGQAGRVTICDEEG